MATKQAGVWRIKNGQKTLIQPPTKPPTPKQPAATQPPPEQPSVTAPEEPQEVSEDDPAT